MVRRSGLTLLVALLFFLSCLAATAHLAMAGGEGCQASHPSVRNCGQTVSMDMGPILPAVWGLAESTPVRTAWVTIPATPGRRCQHQSAPSVPRSPPALPA